MGSEKLFAPAADKGKCVPGLLASRKGQDTFLKSVAAPKLGSVLSFRCRAPGRSWVLSFTEGCSPPPRQPPGKTTRKQGKLGTGPVSRPELASSGAAVPKVGSLHCWGP